MGLPEAIIAFIVVGLPTIALAVLVMRTMQYRERKLELQARIAAEQANKPEYTRELEQRLRVLERIITDSGHGVADEIERLRDERDVRVRSPAIREEERN